MDDITYLKKYYKGDLREAIKELEKGKPVQYIVGNTSFYGNLIKVNESVLIPRFETEELVEKTIKIINKNFNKKIKILDIGTGSGCIAITLKKELDCDVTAVDISEDALEVARENAKINSVNINFVLSDLFARVDDKFDVIISNPPYIAYDEEIMDIVKNNEPHLALYADHKGLFFYEQILKMASKYIYKESLIALEIGYKQDIDVKKLAENIFPNSEIIVSKDLSGRNRFVFILTK